MTADNFRDFITQSKLAGKLCPLSGMPDGMRYTAAQIMEHCPFLYENRINRDSAVTGSELSGFFTVRNNTGITAGGKKNLG